MRSCAVVLAVAIHVDLADQGEPHRLVGRPGGRVDDVADADRVDRAVGPVDPGDAVSSPTWISSMFPLGFSVGMPGEFGGEDRHLHLRAGTLAAVDVDVDLAAIEVDVGDVAVGLVQDVLALLDLVATARG